MKIFNDVISAQRECPRAIEYRWVEGQVIAYEVGDDVPALPTSSDEEVIVTDLWRFRRALTATGWRSSVEAAVSACEDQDVKDAFDYAPEVHSNHPMILAMCHAIGISDEARLQVFRLAQSL